MTENTLKLLQYLQEKNQPANLKETASSIGISWQAVNAIFNQLVKNGYGERIPYIVTDEASGQEKEVKLLALTDQGKNFSNN